MRKAERIYIGGFEVYREFKVNGTMKLERETFHVMDDKGRVAVVETKTREFGTQILNPRAVLRYQLSDHIHIGSATLELDDAGGLISFEQYHPYGTAAYQAIRSASEISLKCYRYTGKERDAETGLYYHGARYYAPWLGRWTSCDPKGLDDGTNLYAYTQNRPVNFTDPTGLQGQERILNVIDQALGTVGGKPPPPPRPPSQDILHVIDQALGTVGGKPPPPSRPPSSVSERTGIFAPPPPLVAPPKEGNSVTTDTPSLVPTPAGGGIDPMRDLKEYYRAHPSAQDYANADVGTVGRAADPMGCGLLKSGVYGVSIAAGASEEQARFDATFVETGVQMISILSGAGERRGAATPEVPSAPVEVPAGGRPVNSGAGTQVTYLGPRATSDINCAQCEGALVEGRGGTSTSFAERSGGSEGLTPLADLKAQLANTGNLTGPTVGVATEADLITKLQAYPAGSQAIVYYINPPVPNTPPSAHVVTAVIGNGGNIMFVDAQPAAGLTRTTIPNGASGFQFFGVVPVQR